MAMAESKRLQVRQSAARLDHYLPLNLVPVVLIKSVIQVCISDATQKQRRELTDLIWSVRAEAGALAQQLATAPLKIEEKVLEISAILAELQNNGCRKAELARERAQG
eukprot:gene7182-288_t